MSDIELKNERTTYRLSRRGFVYSGVGGAIAAYSAMSLGASSSAPIFKGTSIERNPIAMAFEPFVMPLPDIILAGPKGNVSLNRVRGKTRLVSLWAEWCAPCLAEITDLAILRTATSSDYFDIGLILTSSAAKLDRAQATQKLLARGAGSMPFLVERDGGSKVAERLARGSVNTQGGFSLPCTLLVDSKGVVQARMRGVHADPGTIEALKKRHVGDARPDGSFTLTDEDKKLVALGKTVWGGADAMTFARALASGELSSKRLPKTPQY